jgi:hypothetical protein
MYSNSIFVSIFILFAGIGVCDGQSEIEEVIEQIPESKLSYSLGAMGIENGTFEVAEVYSFDHSVKLRTVVYNQSDKASKEDVIDIYYSNGSAMFGMSMSSAQTGLTHIVYDYANAQMITMMNSGGMKVGMSTGFDVEQILESQNMDTTGPVKFEKTGETKNISGFSCDEYRIVNASEKDQDTQQFVWMTTDIDSDWMQSMTKIAQSKNMLGMSKDISADIPQGTVIQMVTKDSKGNLKIVVSVEEINENESVDIQTSDYTFMNFSGQSLSK